MKLTHDNFDGTLMRPGMPWVFEDRFGVDVHEQLAAALDDGRLGLYKANAFLCGNNLGRWLQFEPEEE